MNVEIKTFKATENNELCLEYDFYHKESLSKISYLDADKIKSSGNKWMHDEKIYLITARNKETNELLGGTRIHISNSEDVLPVERAVAHLDSNLSHLANYYREEGLTAEISGLWNNQRGRLSFAITEQLVISAIAISAQLNINTLVSFVGKHTYKVARKMGFTTEETVGNAGDFPYPEEKFPSTVLSMTPNYPENADINVQTKVYNLIHDLENDLNFDLNQAIQVFEYNESIKELVKA
ncbi:hypothetical protein DNU06_04915 [Putridiphycobacter roseus]|uniref:GNAT family N-acetyltransferase n=1 Tax=Putridiphycobacter roseus TaxID=2219161 RepID=A0A2W1NQN8_9FLAO|nr:hypothetical protein [Putridiphycobacter roseus]PZE17962.1 hypothetical protein DNU06_04915 [Putridiphycobacter roseus]